MPISDWPDMWNMLHGELFRLKGTGELNRDIPRMIAMWRIMR